MNPAVKLVNINKQFSARPNETGTMAVDNVNLEIADGEFFTMLGPSGCGKTTTLRMIAGFEEPSSGQILLNGENVAHLPPFHRPVNTVFQDYALFPHMTVAQNIGFGLEMEGKSKDFIAGRVKQMLDLVQLPNMERRFPRQLSGGQQQRVALARALVKEPKVLLLDEPLGALDLKLRKQLQLELKQMQRRLGITFIYVTHDQEEALTMSDRIAVMNKGKVLQIGKPWEIYDAPTNRFVADFIGETNFLDASVDEIRDGGWAKVWVCEKYQLDVNTRVMPVREEMNVTMAIRPEKLNLMPRTVRVVNGIPGVIEEQVYIGTDTRYVVRLPDDQVIVARIQNGVSEQTEYDLGAEVNVHFPPQFTLLLTD